MSKLIRKSNKGFTLIELMIVVAIIGILAAIAIPNFLRFQLKAKSSEGKVNIAAIRTAEESFLAEFGTYVGAAILPAAVPGTQKGAFDLTTATDDGFTQLGWSPEGQVFFQYAVAADVGRAYTISAAADIDGNAIDQAWGYVKTASTGAELPGIHTDCALTGIAGNKLDVVGPCVSTSGQSVF